MANTKSSKGNPASHRMSNAALKARRAKSWQRGAKRKEQNRQQEATRARDNAQRRAAGTPTPWEASRAARAERRATDPEIIGRREDHAAREARLRPASYRA